MHVSGKHLICTVVLALLPAWALAQSFPSKPIRFIVGFPPGGSADPTTRIMGAALSEQMGQPFVVENRPGADGAIGAEQVMRMPADGYTLMFASNSAMTAAVALRKAPTYDPLKDFTPVSMVGRATIFFYVHPDVPARTLREFVAHARANPGKLNYGTGNPLSIPLTRSSSCRPPGSTWFTCLQGAKARSTGPLAGRARVVLSTGSAISNAKDGACARSRCCSRREARCCPRCPIIDRRAFPEVTVRQWAGIFGPAGHAARDRRAAGTRRSTPRSSARR
jgi:hypothetical protein